MLLLFLLVTRRNRLYRLLMHRLRQTAARGWRGISVTEVAVSLVFASVITAALYNAVIRQHRLREGQRINASPDNLNNIAFFLIGRDIRAAGSQPFGFRADAAYPRLRIAANHELEIVSDNNHDEKQETIHYSHVDSDQDGKPDLLIREVAGGMRILIQQIEEFSLSYITEGDLELPQAVTPELVRKIKIRLACRSVDTPHASRVEQTITLENERP